MFSTFLRTWLFLAGSYVALSRGVQPHEPHFTNEWAVHIPGGEDVANVVATDLGYVNKGQIGALTDHYLLTHPEVPARSKRDNSQHTRRLIDHDKVLWVEQQRSLSRQKRDFINKRDEEQAYRSAGFNDNLWNDQWYFHFVLPNQPEKLDLHVIPVWAANITGRGVTVTVLDDGIERNHTDLTENYDPRCSADLNGNDDDPMPRYDPFNENKHGTRCAGEIAMIANNGKCGVGVAYNAKIGGVRMLDGTITDSLEAKAITHNIDYINIFSASWGPNDDGRTVEGPGKLCTAAFEKGIREGRGGKGVIYVWASGNGGSNNDNCDCDGYTGSIYTLSISSASQHFKSPWYAERCASTMATTYSSGNFEDEKIATTDLHNACTQDHTGTSASAPLAAGIFALALERNPEITWRGMQHIVAWTSQYAPLRHNIGWKRNGAGLYVNSRFGFGLLNAEAIVNMADPDTWKREPDKAICTVSSDTASHDMPRRLESLDQVTIKVVTSGCKGQPNEINYLEHVQIKVDMNYTKRGDLEAFLTSPSGTETVLLTKRPGDHSPQGFTNWPFMSVHTWGEKPAGAWTVLIRDLNKRHNFGYIRSITLVLHGTKDMPDHMKRLGGHREYPEVKTTTSALEKAFREKLKLDIAQLKTLLAGVPDHQEPIYLDPNDFPPDFNDVPPASSPVFPQMGSIGALTEEDSQQVDRLRLKRIDPFYP